MLMSAPPGIGFQIHISSKGAEAQKQRVSPDICSTSAREWIQADDLADAIVLNGCSKKVSCAIAKCINDSYHRPWIIIADRQRF